ncbi:MAG TPA: tetratricopeptide repeat protein [Methanocorpusculum sp.]|nr:tetratricopeptide repeat protein [Methanocorpusculum sp.]
MTNPAPSATALSSALALFEKGEYNEVLTLASGTTDPALMLLAARSYLATGKLDIAETLLNSLLGIMPNSSYLHSYLGDVLVKKERDEEAIAEYAEALSLDPDNKAAVRNYADALIRKEDFRAAIPALRSLVRADNQADDVKRLEEIFTKVHEAKEAVSLHLQHFGEDVITLPYTEALLASRDIQKCLEAAHRGWDKEKNTAYLRIYLEALAAADINAAEKAYREALDSFEEEGIDDENVSSIRFSFVLLEKLLGKYDAAIYELKPLLEKGGDAVFQLVAADIAAQKGDGETANTIYRKLIADVMSEENPEWETAELAVNRFTSFLSEVRGKEETAGIISVTLSPFPKAVSLVKIGEAYEAANAHEQAKDWFYRAYRADTIRGGVAYAGYLKRADEIREAETILRYILTNLKSVAELEQAADAVLNGEAELYKLDKTRELVQKKLSASADELTADGREMLAALYLYSAVDAIENRSYEDCKWFCLAGIDVLPCFPEKIHIQDFNDLLIRAKGRALSERPILMEKTAAQAADESPAEEPEEPDEDVLPNLDEREKKIIAFIREHREATEMDLRALLDTRRAAGIVNALIEKTAELGITVIEKRGTGERGEIYGYVGSR